jgi:GTP-binding protein
VGKSSLINALCNRKKLAKTSSLAGRTRLINFFEINKKLLFVDLPGYGFAKASKTDQAKWQSLIGTYLSNSKNLKVVFVLVDIRHEPTELDLMMLNYLYQRNVPFIIVATKLDKIKKSQVAKQKQMLAATLGVGVENIILSSFVDRVGLDDIWAKIESHI